MKTDTHETPPEPVTEPTPQPAPPIPPNGGVDGLSVFQAFARGEAGGSIVDVKTESLSNESDDGEKTKKAQNIDDREAQLAEAIKALEDAPELTYDQRIEKHGISKKEAMTIVADMFEKNFYEKTYPVVGDHVTVVFRTRLQEDQDRVLARIETDAPQYPTTVNNLVAKHNLAASMMEFKGKDFRDKTVQERYDYISRIPDVVTRVLVKKLTKFDDMILDVLDEGAIANF